MSRGQVRSFKLGERAELDLGALNALNLYEYMHERSRDCLNSIAIMSPLFHLSIPRERNSYPSE